MTDDMPDAAKRIEGNSRIPAAAKQRILDQLKEDEIPAALLARLEG